MGIKQITTGLFFFFIFNAVSCLESKKKWPEASSVVIALSSEPHTLDPRRAVDATGMRISSLIFQSLVRLDENLKLQPDLAESWTVLNNTYTFKIPDSILFSNGRKLQVEDIEFSFQQYQSPKSPFYSSFKNIKSIQVQKIHQYFILKLKLKYFSAPFLSYDLPVLKILPKQEVLSDPQGFHKNPIGTGPFVLVKQSSSQIHLRSRGETKIKNVIFKIIRDDLTRYQKVLKKEIDIIQSELPPSKIQSLKKSELPYKVIERGYNSMNYLLIHMQDSLFKNKKARRALALALDRESLIQHKFKGLARPAESFLPPDHPFFLKTLKPFKYNPDLGAAILKENGWSGQKITLKTSNNLQVLSYAKVIAQQLRNIGFQVELKSYEWGTFYKDLNQGQFQLALLRWVGVFDPDLYRVAFHSSQIPPHGRNRGFYINKKLDDLLERARREENEFKRKKLYHRVQKIVYDDLAMIPLWQLQQTAVVKNNIQNYVLPLNGSYDYLTSIFKSK